MVLLKICLLGPFQVWLGGNPVTSFESNKVRALLSFLAVEKDRPHTRDTIAGLLWPDYPQRSAQGNLRWALSSLRSSIKDRLDLVESEGSLHILSSRESVQFNNSSDYWLDLAEFQQVSTPFISSASMPQPGMIDKMLQAVQLYNGKFLDGFSLPDSAPFEEWVLLQREHCGRLYLHNLSLLADYYESCGDYQNAQQFVMQQIELEPWQEEAHQQMMRLLVLSGRRSEAISRYEICRTMLLEGLGVEPSKETRLLYEKIRDGLPIGKFSVQDVCSVEIENIPRPVCVGREQEIFRLNRVLEGVLAGRGQVYFVTGEAGIGKTVLIREFVRRSLDSHKKILALFGSCNAQPEIGGPYLPFLEAIHMLTGDIQPQWLAGTISKEHVQRLRAVIPDTLKTLAEVAPGLIDHFLTGSALLSRDSTYQNNQTFPLDEHIGYTVKRKARLQQAGFFEQYLSVLQRLSRDHPLILVVDDLHWVDTASLSLLLYLGRRLIGSQILILGAYRPDELQSGRRGKRLPLESVINEFQEEFGDILLDLSQVKSRQLVDALLDTHPNRFGEGFRNALFRHTGGNPLFAVELLQSLNERGQLIQTQFGDSEEGELFDCITLSPRVEAVIAERIRRLPSREQELLLTASVQGETFIAEILAAVVDDDNVKTRQRLNNVVSTQHFLLDALSVQHLENTCITRFKFHNFAAQKYLYQSLDLVRRTQLHQKTAEALEAMCSSYLGGSGAPEARAANLAWHFEQAGLYEKAVDYLLRAGREAYRLSSTDQAIALYQQGIRLVSQLPESQSRSHQELSLHIALQAALLPDVGFASSNIGQACARSVELAYQSGDPADICASLFSLITYYLNQSEYRRVLELSSQLDDLAESSRESGAITYARLSKGLLGIFFGDFYNARQHLEFVIASPAFSTVEDMLSPLFQDIRLIARIFICLPLWFLGYPDTAIQKGDEAIRLADDLDHLQSRGLALGMAGGMLSLLRRDCYKTREFAESLYHLSKETKMQSIEGLAAIFLGKYLIDQGRLQEGLSTLQDGWLACQRQGVNAMSTVFLAMMAEACHDPCDGLRMIDDALALARDNGERLYLAELYRIRGELLVAHAGVDSEAETCMQRALYISRTQKARSLELRAAISLARLYMQQNQIEKAYRMLGGIYDQFTEGLDTLDLRQAGELLRELSSFPPVGVKG